MRAGRVKKVTKVPSEDDNENRTLHFCGIGIMTTPTGVGIILFIGQYLNKGDATSGIGSRLI
jgi:hypothetical protein